MNFKCKIVGKLWSHGNFLGTDQSLRLKKKY